MVFSSYMYTRELGVVFNIGDLHCKLGKVRAKCFNQLELMYCFLTNQRSHADFNQPEFTYCF